MKTVFVIAPFRADTNWGIQCNVHEIEQAVLALADQYPLVVAPQLMWRNFHGTKTDGYWLQACRELLRRCDSCVALPHWETSSGSLGEISYAEELGRPVSYAWWEGPALRLADTPETGPQAGRERRGWRPWR